LKADGTVVVAGDDRYGLYGTESWQDIVAIAAGSYNTVGLKSDGTVVGIYGKHEIENWRDIVAIQSA